MEYGWKYSADDAFDHLVKNAYDPSRTHRKADHAMKTAAKVTTGVVGALETALLIPLAVIALPAFTALAVGAAIAGGVEAGTGVILDHVKGFKDSKDLPKLGQGQQQEKWPVLLRESIRSIILPWKTLRDLAGDRPGTRGPVYLKDVVEGIRAHYFLAHRNWQAHEHEVNSCRDAENLVRVFAEADYHLAKMSAYARALQHYANAYVAWCDRNTGNVRTAWDNQALPAIQKTLQKDVDWHEHHCDRLKHCYRTHKLERLFHWHVA